MDEIIETERKRCRDALAKFGPADYDVGRYLSADEQQEYLKTIEGAVEAFFARDALLEAQFPGYWLSHPSAALYCYWTRQVEKRRAADIYRRRKERERQEWVDKVSAAAAHVREQLKHTMKPLLNVTPALQGHHPEDWGYFQVPTNEQILSWATPELWDKLPPELNGALTCKFVKEMLLVPRATYISIEGIPCLNVTLDAYILVGFNLWLNDFPGLATAGYTTKSSFPQKLGTLYLGPYEKDVTGLLIVPLQLITMLLKGKEEIPGITVIEHDEFGFTTYEVAGIDEPIEVADDFAAFTKEVAEKKGLGPGLLEAGFIDHFTADLIQAKEGIPLPNLTQALMQPQSADEPVELKEALLGMGYQEKIIDQGIKAVSFTDGMSFQDKVTAVLQVIQY